MKKTSANPYQFNVSESYSTSLTVLASGKSVRKETSTAYFPEQSFYTLHYVVQGEADCVYRGEKHKLSPGDILTVPDRSFCELTVTKTPYINYWINIKGTDAARLFSYADINETPVIRIKENLSDLFEQIRNEQGPETYKQLMVLSFAYQLLSTILKYTEETHKTNYKKFYTNNFISYIEANYNDNSLRIPDIAKYVGLSSCQLYRVVTEEFGVSPINYLLNYRISMSKILLKSQDLKIADVSRLCGFTDPLYFSRLFSKKCGMSPGEYRKNI